MALCSWNKRSGVRTQKGLKSLWLENYFCKPSSKCSPDLGHRSFKGKRRRGMDSVVKNNAVLFTRWFLISRCRYGHLAFGCYRKWIFSTKISLSLLFIYLFIFIYLFFAKRLETTTNVHLFLCLKLVSYLFETMSLFCYPSHHVRYSRWQQRLSM